MKALLFFLCSIIGVCCAATEVVDLGLNKLFIKKDATLSDKRDVKFFVPKEWQGKSVRFRVWWGLHKADLVVDLNGKRVGDILRPAGEIELAPSLIYGATNTLTYFATETGVETARGAAKTVSSVHRAKRGFTGRSELLVSGKEWIDDVFAETSWRAHELRLHIELGGAVQGGKLVATITDPNGRAVKKLTRQVKKGEKALTIVEPWRDAQVWEMARPYLYKCSVRYADDEFKPFKFGFREIWREGKEIMMNGHKAHLRTCYSFGSDELGARFLREVGYNVLTYNHQIDAAVVNEQVAARLSAFDEMGMGVFICGGAGVVIAGNKIHEDPEAAQRYREFQRTFHRITRNHPCVIAVYVTQMISCVIETHNPLRLGMYEGAAANDKLINAMRKINCEYNPNVLYYSHADGCNGDISSGNLYLNFTPIQEREEWLSCWATNGVMPWHSAEFGEPYQGNWYWQRLFLATEHLAQFYGDRAYETEHADVPSLALEAGKGNATGHGSKVGGDILPTHFPLFWELRREMTWRTNSRWRAFGHGGGNVYFNLREAYGTPPGTKGYGRYGEMKEYAGGRPEWANEAFDIHQLGNKDLCAFIGGAPEFTDHTHAYWSGEKIRKQIVLIWDGFGTTNISGRVRLDGREVAHFSRTLKQGDIAFVPFEFTAPTVATKTRATLATDFDSLPLEFHPRTVTPIAAQSVALFDPDGSATQMLRHFNIPFTPIKSIAAAEQGHYRFLVIGKNALDKETPDITAAALNAGMRILILPQQPEIWRSLGFDVLDPMARRVFVRDRANPAFAGLAAEDLESWRGAPTYGSKPYGQVMSHAAQRGPRWTRTHTVAALMLKIPERVGFIPLMDGEFDMSYSPLLRFHSGAGAMTFCTLDFEGRIASDPAATLTAHAVLSDFFASPLPAASQLFFAGEGAVALANRVGIAAPRIISGGYKAWSEAAREGARVVVFGEDEELARNGFKFAPKELYRAEVPKNKAFRGIGPSLLRWTDKVSARVVTACPPGAKMFADGLFAVQKVGTGAIIVARLNPDEFTNRYAEDKDQRPTAQLNEERVVRLYARFLTNLGAQCSPDITRRMLYAAGLAAHAPLPAVHVLGPFCSDKDDSVHMLNSDWCKKGEAMCIAGDFNPNENFVLPQGGTANWRPILDADENGCFDFARLHSVALPVYYAMAIVPRKYAGEAELLLGADWRFRLWVNGEEVYRADAGAHYPKFHLRIKLKAGDNVIAFKLGGGRAGCKIWALLETEKTPNLKRSNDRTLDALRLYEHLIPGFDPYQFHYW